MQFHFLSRVCRYKCALEYAVALVMAGMVLAFAATAAAQVPSDSVQAKRALPPGSRASASPSAELGMPFPGNHYTPDEYGGGASNWAVTQDARGVVFLGNQDGLKTYDGTTWRTIPTAPDDDLRRMVRALHTGRDGTVYVGFVKDFGRLRPDSSGTLAFESLLPYVPEPHRDFEDVWTTFSTDRANFFQSREKIFRWDGESITVFESETGFHTAFSVGNRVFAREFSYGLVELVGDAFRLVPNGDAFQSRPIQTILPYPDGRLLIGTATDGLYLFDGRDVTPFETPVDAYVAEHRLYTATALDQGVYALGTLGGGVVLIDATGRHLRTLYPEAQLPDGVINDVHTGNEGELWVAYHNAGIQRLDVLSSITRFDDKLGLRGIVEGIQRQSGRLYVGTGRGLFTLATPEDSVRSQTNRTEFRQVAQVPIVLAMDDTAEGLLVGTQLGLHRVRPTNDGGNDVDKGYPGTIFAVSESAAFPGRTYFGTRQGIRVRSGSESRRIEGFDDEAKGITEAPDGSLWIRRYAMAVHVQLSASGRRIVDVTRYGTDAGVPDAFVQRTFFYKDDLFLMANQRLYRFEAGQERFVPDSTLFGNVEVEGDFHFFSEGANGELWAAWGDRVYHAPRPTSGAPQWESVEPLHFEKSQEVSVHVDANDVVWIADGNQLFRHDLNQQRAPVNAFEALVRGIYSISDERTLYGGAPLDAAADVMRVPYGQNDLRFEFAAPLYGITTPNEYQYRLAGSETDWSDWSAQTSVVYTNLFEGTYAFEVRARNERGALSRPASVQFRITPPWYRTVWAYGVYLVGLVVLGVGVRRYYAVMEENERQRQRTQNLERERTVNDRLQRANQRLRQANDLKENFLASTSHELRTPLTNIIGFADILRAEADASLQPHVTVINENGQRLLRTLDALLDLASLRAGAMSPALERVNVRTVVQDVAREFEGSALRKNVDLDVEVTDAAVYAMLDARYLEQILRNLIDNAVKFTDEGAVRVRLAADVETISLSVADTGIGIDSSFIPDLFRDFKQESQGLTRTYDGSGLGLAITARLVELMDGAITVKSVKGEGSTFTVRFPRRQPAPTHAHKVTLSG